MRTCPEWMLLRGLAVVCCVTVTGCVSSSTHSDLSRVQELTRSSGEPRAPEDAVEPEADKRVQELLREPLDADAAVRVALLANRELRATLHELGVARGQLLQAGLLPNPRAEAELLPERSSELELRVEYDLTRAVLAPLRAHAFDAELESARYRVASAVVELAQRVRIGFLRVQASEQRLAIGRDALLGLEAAREAARAMHEAGNVAALDLATEESAFEKGQVDVERLALSTASERERFTRLLGLAQTRPTWRVRSQLAAAPTDARAPDQLEQRTLAANLALKGARQHLIALARRAGAVRFEGLVPDISVDVHALTGHPETNDATTGDKRDWRYGGGVAFSVPLFDRQQGNALILDSNFKAGIERYRGLAADLRSEARELWQRVVSAHGRARRYQDVILPGQRRVTEQSLLQYNAMQIGVFTLLAARRDQLNTQLAYIDTLREYWSAVTQIEALLHGARIASEPPRESSGMLEESVAAGEHDS